MDTLVVVHAENLFTVPSRQVPSVMAQSARQAFEMIGHELDNGYDGNGKKAYYLAWDSDSPDSVHIYSAIRKHMDKMKFIKRYATLPMQYFMAKKQLIEDGACEISLAGVERRVCVKHMLDMLLGKYQRYFANDTKQHIAENIVCPEPDVDEIYKMVSEIYDIRLSARIREDLTDGLNWGRRTG